MGRRTRVRQHANPLQIQLQKPAEPLDWEGVYADATRPLVVDAGCGYGRFLIALSRQAMPQHNMLGLEIRGPIIERANRWVEAMGLAPRVRYAMANATVSLEHMLASYSAPIDLLAVQFPDPHFKSRHKKRRTVQARAGLPPS